MAAIDSCQNHLIDETSPYLLQHAHNPVDWYPWKAETLELARQLDKPILLSIGYSACHWCHVMAHESFEDPATAELMNARFINIKVDREERPDLDKIYQTAHHLLNQRGGGWPLTVILTPDDHTPFFAGTYFPDQPRYGMPSFRQVLQRVAEFYNENRDSIKEQNVALLDAFNSLNPAHSASTDMIDVSPLEQARDELVRSFDHRYGGFGNAPKFPHPANLERLLRQWQNSRSTGGEDRQVRNMLHDTMQAMAAGGIYDQLGGGFYRYAVDERWMIPHFEKMLYDNGPLLALYAEAGLAMNAPLFKHIAIETGEWVLREMQSTEGGYYSTLDADSDGEEGRFYTWEPDEIRQRLTEQEFQLVEAVYGLSGSPNFEGRWHLNVHASIDDVAETFKLPLDVAQNRLNAARQKLFAAREQRNRPGRDEKILCAWNGLMIKGMAAVGRRLQRDDFIHSAQRAVDFIHDRLFQDHRLLASYKDGKAQHSAYLDDYAFLMDGLLELLQAHWRDEDLDFLIALADTLLTSYEDRTLGGFYFTAHDHEALIHRPKPIMDEATPAGNAVAASALNRLGHLLGNTRYLRAAEKTICNSWYSLQQLPFAHCAMLNAIEEYLFPPPCIVLRGSNARIKPWHELANQTYHPGQMCFAIDEHSVDLPGVLSQYKPQAEVTAYVCEGTQCLTPITDWEKFQQMLKE